MYHACGAPLPLAISFSRSSPAQALVQHALRQAMTADAQTLQFKLPPAGVPLPPTHVSPGVASGAPVVEGLAVTSLWTVQLLKLLSQVHGLGMVVGGASMF